MPPIQDLTMPAALLLSAWLLDVLRSLPRAVPAAAAAPVGVRSPNKAA